MQPLALPRLLARGHARPHPQSATSAPPQPAPPPRPPLSAMHASSPRFLQLQLYTELGGCNAYGGTSPETSRKNCDGSTGMALGARVGCTRAPTSYEKHVHRARSTRAAVLQPPLTRISFAAQASGASDDKYYYDTDDASNFYMELWGLRTSRMLTHTRARFRRAQTPAQASTQTRGWGDAYARALTCACARLCRRCSPARGNLP